MFFARSNTAANLIFSLQRYREVIAAYISGIEQAHANGHDVSKIHSVASFFVSRVDSAIDKALEDKAKAGAAARTSRRASGRMGVPFPARG